MTCRVVAISRSLGAGGEETGGLVAKQLGFRYADEEIITRAAKKAGIAPELVARAEVAPNLMTRILESMGRSPAIAPEGYAVYLLSTSQEPDPYETLIERVLHEVAHEGEVVIVAHAASIPLAGMPGLLRVLVTASPELRAQRLSAAVGLKDRAAKKAVADSDGQRRDYLRRFYNVRGELPTHYDLVLNTDLLTPEQAAQLVVAAAQLV